jgi:hypothetical protein
MHRFIELDTSIYWGAERCYCTVILAGSKRRNFAALLYKMSRFCLGLRKSAEVIASNGSLIAPGQIISSEPNMIRFVPKAPGADTRS